MSVIGKNAQRRQALWSWFATAGVSFFKKYLDAQDGQEMALMAWEFYEAMCECAVDCGEPCMPIPPCSKIIDDDSSSAADDGSSTGNTQHTECLHQFVLREITSEGKCIVECKRCLFVQYFSLFENEEKVSTFDALPLIVDVREAAHKARRYMEQRNIAARNQKKDAK